MATSSSPSRRGRPPDATLRQRILEAARLEFALNGLSGASLARIARSASCSRVSIYDTFGSKEALYQATLVRPVVEKVQAATTAGAGSPREVLIHLGASFMNAVTDPAAIEHIHMLYRGSRTSPALAQDFYAEGPQQVVCEVNQVLSRMVSDGVLAIEDVDMAAEQFVAMVRGNDQMRALLSLNPLRSKKAKAQYIETCVDVFMRGYAPTSP